MRRQNAAAKNLLCPEGLTVGTLVHGRIVLVSAHQNSVQRAVVLGVAVIGAGLDGAFDALVCMAVHKSSSFLFGTALVWPGVEIPFRKNLLILHFFAVCGIVVSKRFLHHLFPFYISKGELDYG